MTKPFTMTPIWAGLTVAVLASGASLTQEVADSVKHLPRIAVRRAFRLAPDADMLVSLDGPPNHGFWDESRVFAGLRICGVECDLDAMYVNMPAELVALDPVGEIQIRNNGLAAIRLAAQSGAAKIILLGFDGLPYKHFYDQVDGDWDQYPGLAVGLAALISELRAQGIAVETEAPSAHIAEPAKRAATKEL
jgi:hypothetical protein